MTDENVVPFVAKDATIVPLQPIDLVRSAQVRSLLDQGASLTEIGDDMVISFYRVVALSFHNAKNELIKRGHTAESLDEGVKRATKDESALAFAVDCGRKTEELLESGVKFSSLDRENALKFFISSAARLVAVENEIDRRGLADPADPRSLN